MTDRPANLRSAVAQTSTRRPTGPNAPRPADAQTSMCRRTERPADPRVYRPSGGGRPRVPAGRRKTTEGRWRRLAEFPGGPSTPTYPLIYGGSLIVALSVPGSVLPLPPTFSTKRQTRIPIPLPRRHTTAPASTTGTIGQRTTKPCVHQRHGPPIPGSTIAPTSHPRPRNLPSRGRPTRKRRCVDPRPGQPTHMRRRTARPADPRVDRSRGGGRPRGPASRRKTTEGRWRRLAEFPEGPSTPTYPLIYGGSLIVALSVPGSVLPLRPTFSTKRQTRIPVPPPRRRTTATESTNARPTPTTRPDQRMRIPASTNGRAVRGVHIPASTNDRADRGMHIPASTNDRAVRGMQVPASTNDRADRRMRIPALTNDPASNPHHPPNIRRVVDRSVVSSRVRTAPPPYVFHETSNAYTHSTASSTHDST
jgi:hypothetical protein